jgi:RNA polymerase sigma-70 factor (ECF subfamily)
LSGLSLNTNQSHIIYSGIPDQKTFTCLFEEYYSRLCLFAFRMVHHQQTSEDLVQDCFTRLWQRRNKMDWSKDVTPYLYRMVRNACYNYLRDKKYTSCFEEDIPDEHDFIHRVIEAETLYEIHLAIRRLPPKCSNIFKALFLEGKEPREISKELNISESTIRSHKATALLLLRHSVTTILLLVYLFSR